MTSIWSNKCNAHFTSILGVIYVIHILPQFWGNTCIVTMSNVIKPLNSAELCNSPIYHTMHHSFSLFILPHLGHWTVTHSDPDPAHLPMIVCASPKNLSWHKSWEVFIFFPPTLMLSHWHMVHRAINSWCCSHIHVTRSRKMSHMSAIFNFDFSI